MRLLLPARPISNLALFSRSAHRIEPAEDEAAKTKGADPSIDEDADNATPGAETDDDADDCAELAGRSAVACTEADARNALISANVAPLLFRTGIPTRRQSWPNRL
jgi:hypothetical protein